VPPAELRFPTPPERTFEVLSEPRRYAYWVPGARHVESHDPEWPALGAQFRHQQGVGPLVVHDTTQVTLSEPPRRLQLEARVRPLLVADVELRLEPDGDGGTRVWMDERVTGGLLAPVLRLPVFAPLLRLRNREALRRLLRVAQGQA
jgi:uncharacterized protein YndB with AHSA1/START domain